MVELKNWEIPPRSYLYHLAPIGVGTPLIESLTSYICRLAQALNLTAGALLQEIFVSATGKLNLPAVPGFNEMYRRGGPVLLGVTPFAATCVEHLTAMTLRPDLIYLTMLPWRQVLGNMSLIKAAAHWCPQCYEEQRRSGKPIYTPLLWTLTGIEICTTHKCRLLETCPNPKCRKPQLHITRNMQTGFCQVCETWLGQAKTSPRFRKIASEDVWSLWVNRVMGELVASTITEMSRPTTQHMSGAFQQFVAKHGLDLNEPLPGFSKLLHQLDLRPNKLWTDWLHNRLLGKPTSLEKFLLWCWQIQCTPLQFIVNKSHHPTQRVKPNAQKHRQRVLPVKARARQALRQALKKTDTPLSLTQVARNAQTGTKQLKVYFPGWSGQVVNRYIKWRIGRSKLNPRLIPKAVRSIYVKGEYPSQDKTFAAIGRPNLKWERAAREIWREAIKALGF